MNSEVKKVLVKNDLNFDKLKSMIVYDFDSVIDDFFKYLSVISCSNKRKNVLRFCDIIDFLEKNICLLDKGKVDYIIGECLKLKNIAMDKDVCLRLDEFLNSVYYEASDRYKCDMAKTLKYLMYSNKSIRRIKIFLSSVDKSFFSCEQYNNIIKDLLKKFNTNDKIDNIYYYKITILLLEKMSKGLLSKNRKVYLSILDKINNHSEYVDDLFKLISGNNISDSVLISRFGRSFSFPYNERNIIVKSFSDDIPTLQQGAVTIDNSNTLKMDDAIYFKRNRDNTYTLFVHVSFVPSLIDFDSIVNKEAMKRYKSMYAFEWVIPIIPDDLVLNNFSLMKNVYRNVVTFSVKLDKDMNIISNSFRINRTNVKIIDNLDYDRANLLIKDNNSDIGKMLRGLSIFSFKCNSDIDVERAFRDNNYFNRLFCNDISKDIVRDVMRNINHCVAKYFVDRNIPYLFKYTCFNSGNYSKFMNTINNNYSLIRNADLISEFKDSFFDIKFSVKPKNFFEFDCYSCSTDPLWKYSALYNQYLINNFVFCKKGGADYREQWYNRTRVLADEMNSKKSENKDIETVCRSLCKIRSKY